MRYIRLPHPIPATAEAGSSGGGDPTEANEGYLSMGALEYTTAVANTGDLCAGALEYYAE